MATPELRRRLLDELPSLEVVLQRTRNQRALAAQTEGAELSARQASDDERDRVMDEIARLVSGKV